MYHRVYPGRHVQGVYHRVYLGRHTRRGIPQGVPREAYLGGIYQGVYKEV